MTRIHFRSDFQDDGQRFARLAWVPDSQLGLSSRIWVCFSNLALFSQIGFVPGRTKPLGRTKPTTAHIGFGLFCAPTSAHFRASGNPEPRTAHVALGPRFRGDERMLASFCHFGFVLRPSPSLPGSRRTMAAAARLRSLSNRNSGGALKTLVHLPSSLTIQRVGGPSGS